MTRAPSRLLLLAALALSPGLGAAVQRPPETPVVIELFTAQGCAGCPDANARLEAVAERTDVIALTYAVDYWDYLGWPDTFARPEFTQRQRAYARPLRLRAVATPQVVVDGRRLAPRDETLTQVVAEEAARREPPPEIEFRSEGDAVGVGSGAVPSGGAEVVAVTYRPGPQVVAVQAGDNRGRSVRHVNVVSGVRRLGDWTGRPVLYDAPAAEGEAVAVMVQAKRDRRILAAAVRAP